MGADVCKRRPREGARTQRPWGADTGGSATRGRARTARLQPGGGPGRTLLPRGRAGGRRVREERLGLAVCEGRAGRDGVERPCWRGAERGAPGGGGRGPCDSTQTTDADRPRGAGGKGVGQGQSGRRARPHGDGVSAGAGSGGGVSVFPLILFFGFELKFSLPSNKERG